MNRKVVIPVILLASVFLSACTTFYKVRSVKNTKDSYVEPLYRYDYNKYQFVVHSSNLMWGMDNVQLTPNEITGTYTDLDPKEITYYNKLKDQKNARVPSSDLKYIYQVHVFANRFSQNNGLINISDKDIEGVNIYNMNDGLTTLTVVGTAGLTALGAIGAFLAIACSCPHVYTYDGETYNFMSGVFTGAVSPILERDDYKIIPDLVPESSQYKLMIKSDDKEEQYINNLELMVIQHEKNILAIPDQNGKVYSISDPQSPSRIVNDEGENLFYTVNNADESAYNFNSIAESGFSNIYATFNLEDQDNDIKLILGLNNTVWGGFVYKEFSKLFGWYHDEWVKKNQRKTKEEMQHDMKNQGITMTVSIKTGNSWTGIENVDLIGDATFNTLVIPIDKKWLTTNEPLEVRLQCGYMFWSLDYIAIDNTSDKPLNIYYPELIIAGDTTKTSIAALNSDDDKYLELLSKGDSTYIEFDGLIVNDNMARTIVLKSKGYFLPDPTMEGKFNVAELRKFKKPAELSRYSKRLYDQYFNGIAFNR